MTKLIDPEISTKKLDIPVFEEEYPFWKIIVWRYVRVFMAGFVAALSVDLFISGNPDLIVTAIKSAIAGGLAALSLALREDKNKDAAISKIPM